MVLVPAGEYVSGAPEFNDESPVRPIQIDGFYIDAREVIQRQFTELMGTNPSEYKGETRPVERVTWYEARDFCLKTGKRLPTEAEWEKAARAGTVTRFDWGEAMEDARAWHWDNSGRETHPAGERPPNPLGLYDMIGNVWEWTADWYEETYYATRPSANPPGPWQGDRRVLRGGSFMDRPEDLRVTRRNWDYPTSRFKNFGFRCAADLKK